MGNKRTSHLTQVFQWSPFLERLSTEFVYRFRLCIITLHKKNCVQANMSHCLGMLVRRAEHRQNKAGNVGFLIVSLERFPLSSSTNDTLSMLIRFSIISLLME